MAVRATTGWTGLLTTPLAIYEELSKYFPSAQAETDVNTDGLVTMRVRVVEMQPSFTIESAVETTSFSQVLTKLARQIQLDKIRGIEDQYPIDTHHFSSLERLQDWKKFRRVMYERSGGGCVEALVLYLKNPCEETHATLVSLGLTSELVEKGNFQKNDMEYFLAASKKILEQPAQEKDLLVESFQTRFPSIFSRILQQRTEDRLIEECKQVRDPYQPLLLRLREQVVGQELATHTLVSELISQKSQKQNRTFLFIGPTGVGKTALAKAISKEKAGLVTIFMNQYTGAGDVWKLFGSATGYVGASDKPNFAKEIDRYSARTKFGYEVRNLVVLFDEFEKAHSTVKQSLLSLFDEGQYTAHYSLEGEGNGMTRRRNMIDKYIFTSCMFICTSNLFQAFLVDCFHRSLPVEDIRTGFINLNSRSQLEEHCSLELLGRVTIVPFGPISRGECYRKLLEGKLEQFVAEVKTEFLCREVAIGNDQLTRATLEEKLYGNGTDIRRVWRYFSDVKAVVYREKAKWGNMETKKIVIMHDGNRGLCLKLFTFDRDFNCYCEVLAPIQLP